MQIDLSEIKKEVVEFLNNGKAEAIKELIEDYPAYVSVIPNTIIDTLLEYGFRQGFTAGMKYVHEKIGG